MIIISNKGKFAQKSASGRKVAEDELCALEPFHFFENYIKLDGKSVGLLNFVPSAPQRKYLDALLSHHNVITVQPRKAGLTTASLVFLLWKILFTPNTSVGVVLPTHPMLNSICDAFRNMYLNVDPGIKPAPLSLLRDCFRFSNGSSFSVFWKTVPAGLYLDTVFLSDFAILQLPDQQQCFQKTLSSLSPSGSIIIGSTPARKGDLFHQLWQNALAGNQFYPFLVRWQDVWSPSTYLSIRSQIGDDAARTELDCEFV
jgi:hypothetical protein